MYEPAPNLKGKTRIHTGSINQSIDLFPFTMPVVVCRG
jgi:hypothetical protein